MSDELSHLDADGTARMVDVGGKPVTKRMARAGAICCMSPKTAELLQSGEVPKGDVFQVARIAGITAAKRTDELIPLCHGVVLDSVSVDFQWLPNESGFARLAVEACSSCLGRTGVEMEAMVAVSVASLTIYDMCKSVDRQLRVSSIELLEKTGGAHGDYRKSQEHK